MDTLAAQMPAAYSRSSDGSAALYQSMGYWSQPQNPSYLASSTFEYMGRPLNSISMDFQTRSTNSLTTTEGLHSPYDNLSLFPASMDSSGVQQQQRMNASPQRSLQPTQQDFIHTSPAPSNRISPLSPYSDSNVARQNDRPFKCDQCPQSFNRNHDLKRHKRIHLAVKPFPCGHCEKSFSRKDALKRHILVKGCGKPAAEGASNTDVNKQTAINKSEAIVNSTEGKPKMEEI